MSQTTGGGDVFCCAAGSEAPASSLSLKAHNNAESVLRNTRCPLCGHLAVAHDLNLGGTCDVCNAARRVVNALVDGIRSGTLAKVEPEPVDDSPIDWDPVAPAVGD